MFIRLGKPLATVCKTTGGYGLVTIELMLQSNYTTEVVNSYENNEHHLSFRGDLGHRECVKEMMRTQAEIALQHRCASVHLCLQ